MKNSTNSNSSPSKYPFLAQGKDCVYLSVRVQPRAAKNEVAGFTESAVKIRLKSPPVDGEANKALITFLSKLLKIKKISLDISSGSKSRNKRVALIGKTLSEMEDLFGGLLS